MKDILLLRNQQPPGKRIVAVILALLSSIGSISVAVAAGWQRGTASIDQAVFAGIGFIAVLVGQFMPSLGTRLGLFMRSLGAVIWVAAMAYTAWGHAWFLLAAQERAGAERAASVMHAQTTLPRAGRQLSEILTDKADLTEQLARLATSNCEGACAERLHLRKEALHEHLAALDTEAQASAANTQFRVRLEEQVRQAREDLVGTHLAASLGVPYAAVTWVMALTFALILEGVGCFCWTVVLQSADTRSSVTTAEVTPSVEVTDVTDAPPAAVTEVTPANLPDDRSCSPLPPARDLTDSSPPRVRNFAADVTRVTEAMRDLAFDLTVVRVRELLRCGQGHARKVRQYVAEAAAHAVAKPGD